MDNKTIFVRTSKGEDEVRSRTAHLPGDVKRALLMVDGEATIGEIRKRAAPSLRPGLDKLLEELEKDGYIKKDLGIAKIQDKSNLPKMAVPAKVATSQKRQPVADEAADLDFMSGFSAPKPNKTAKAAKVVSKDNAASGNKAAESAAAAAMDEMLKAEAEKKALKEIEAAKLIAQREAEAILRQAEAEAARIRQETVLRAQAEAEAARIKAEQENTARIEAAAKARQLAEAEAARIKAEQENMARIEAAAKARQLAEAEAARIKAEQENRMRLEAAAMAQQAEAERLKAEQEAEKKRIELELSKVRAELEAKARLEAAAREQARIQAENEAAKIREEAERKIKLEAAAREAAARELAASVSGKAPDKPAAFAFDSFQVDQPLYTSESHIEKKPQLNEKQPARQQQSPSPATDADSKASHEQILRAMQERRTVEERLAAEELAAKKLAEQQDKRRLEAEQRAQEAAKLEAEQASRQQMAFTAIDAPVAKQAPIARTYRKPFSWGRLFGFFFKLGLFLLVLLVGALFIIPYVVPMRDYLPQAEQMLSAKLNQPVHIGRLSGRILPMPRLELGEIYIGDAKQFTADDAKINFSLMGIFTEEKPVNSVDFQGVKVRGAWVRNAAVWLQKMADEKKYPVSRITITKGTLDADVFELTGIEGELEFGQDKKFVQTHLRSNAGKYALVISVNPENRLSVAITLRDAALPLLPNWQFDELVAKGEINTYGLTISDFDSRILGGAMQGNAVIDWRSGWRVQGAMTAKAISMQKLNKLLEGDIEGSARFRMISADLAGLPNSATLDGNFKTSDGSLNGMEIVETARTRSKENIPGGRAHYDELAGVISYADGVYHFRQTKISANTFVATATFDVDPANQQLSGKMNVNLSMHDLTTSANLQMGGTIVNPTLRYAP